MLIFKTLHILSMFTSVTAFIGQGLFVAIAYRRRDARALATVYDLAGRRVVTAIGIASLILGIIFGLVTAAVGGLDFTKGWLIAAYVLVAAIIVFNNLPFVRRLLELGGVALEAQAAGQPGDAVAREMATTPVLPWLAVNVTLYVAVIVDMVLKPF